MGKMVYSWKAGTQGISVSAQTAGAELEKIRRRNNGRLEAEDVVTASRPANAPLHGEFEWDDALAAEAHRKSQAMYMIRHIDVVVNKPNGAEMPIRAFVSVKRDEDRSYTSLQHALSDAELRAQVVAAAFAELVAWRKRHAELTELASIFATIDQARAA